MWTVVIFVVVLAAIGGLLGYIWTHRSGRLARGIGSAGASYNEFYGQGRPPEVVRPAEESAAPDKL
ncbi:hypothetical protein D1871_06270 [Nakamurella silvestris]|nr:hypothetical protein D1871_06270 [Nakamurella silvestris]